MIDPNLFGRIDRVLHECDASNLPPLRTARFEVTDGNTTTFQAPARFNAEPDPTVVELHMDTTRFDRAVNRLSRWLRGHR